MSVTAPAALPRCQLGRSFADLSTINTFLELPNNFWYACK